MADYRLNDPDKGLIGPIGLQAVRDLINAGVIQDDVQVSVEGGPWMPIKTFTALFGPVQASGGPKPTYAGDLGKHSFFKVFYRFHNSRVTGLLTLKNDLAQKDVYLEDGRPTFIASNLPDERLGEFLVQRGKIERDDLEVALESMKSDKNRLGYTLIRLGLIDHNELYSELTEQQTLRLVDLCSWERGRYQFFTGVRYLGDMHELHLEASDLVLRAAREMSETLLYRRLQPHLGIAVRRHAHAELDGGSFKLNAFERRALDLIDGRLTLGQVLDTAGTDVERRKAATRVAYLCWEIDAVSFGSG